MIGNEFGIKICKGGWWRVDGDGPAGFHIPNMPRTDDDLRSAVDLGLRRLGLELVTLVPGNISARITFRRIES